jgi:hypothetical protein
MQCFKPAIHVTPLGRDTTFRIQMRVWALAILRKVRQ